MRGISTTVSAAAITLSYLLSTGSLQAQSFSPSDFVLTLKEEDKLEIGYGSNSITVDAGGAWSSVEGAAGNTYAYSGPVKIGAFSVGSVDASVGPDGVKFITTAGFDLGSLSLSAGELALELMPGDQITGQHDFLTFDKKDFVLYTAINTGLEFGIGSSTSISIPTPGDVSASLAVEVTKGSLYYEGPIPNPAMLANGVNKFIGSASGDKDSGNMATGGFGFSVDKSFTYESAVAVFKSSEKPPASEKFKANVAMLGEFELAEMANVVGTFMVDVETGRVGVNGTGSIGFEMLGASVGMELGTASFIVDKKGVRLGSQMGGDDNLGLPNELENIAHFLLPGLGAGMSASGTFKSGGDFIIGMTIDRMNMFGIDMSDSSFSLSPKGLDVLGKMHLDGIGKVKVKGSITNESCYLEVDKFKFIGFDLSSPKIKPCKMAEKATMAFVGDLKIMGETLSSINGTSHVKDATKAFLSKDHKFSVGFHVKEKFGVNGGVAGGNVKLDVAGDANMQLSKTGELSGTLDFDGSAKFCGKVKIAGKKFKKCKKVHSGISGDFDAEIGCIKLSAETKILGEKIKVNGGKVCPWPSSGKYKPSDEFEDAEGSDSDDNGVMAALMTSTGHYVSWPQDRGAPFLTTDVSDSIGWTFQGLDEGKCISDGSLVLVRLGDIETQTNDWYMNVEKDKSTSLNGKANAVDAVGGIGEQDIGKFYIGKVKMAGNCLSDGDVITLKNKEFKRYWSVSDGKVIASNKAGDSQFTVVLDPGWE